MTGKAQVIDPREAGGRQLTLQQPVFAADAVARAEETLEAMSGAFEKWLEADLAKLQAARLDAEHARWSNDSLTGLWRVAHDLKGLGATYGYPLVTQIAASLCRLIETDAGKAAARRTPSLVTAHVDGLRAAVRDRVTIDAHPVGKALLAALEYEVARLNVAPR